MYNIKVVCYNIIILYCMSAFFYEEMHLAHVVAVSMMMMMMMILLVSFVSFWQLY